MSRWWRAYDEAVDDPKLIMLGDKTHRAWFNLMCIASLNGGALPDIKVVAVKLRTSVQRAAALLTELVTAGLFDRRDDGTFEPHNWNARQFKSDTVDVTAAERMRRYRALRRNDRNGDGRVTVPIDREQKTETERKKETRVPALDDGWPDDYRDQFWGRFPNKVGKPKALAKLDACRNRGVVFTDVIEGLERYIQTKPADRAWLNPETFLNQERWTDQPAAVSPQGNSNGRRTVQDAARDLHENILARIQAFDEPAPGGAIRRGEGEDVVRLLPARGR